MQHKVSGGAGGNGAPLATNGSAGSNGKLSDYGNFGKTYGGGGGGGGGGDANPQDKMSKAGTGGRGGTGVGGESTGGKGGNATAAAGAGGGGSFILVASGGVTFSGTGEYGTGQGAVFGTFTNNGSFPDGLPGVNSYSSWEALGASDYYLDSGSGGGGAGGAGQAVGTPTHTTPTVGGVKAASAGMPMYANAGALTLTSSPNPIHEPTIQSAAQNASSNPATGSAVPGIDFGSVAQHLSTRNPLLTGWPATPLGHAPFGGSNVLPLAQLLQNSMAGWTGPSQAQLAQIAQHFGEFEHQVLETVLADLATDPFASVLQI